MTKVQNPIIGRAKGSAGGMTFSKNSDQNVMRAKAFEVNNPKTTAQTTQRDFFKEVQSIVDSVSPEQLRSLFGDKPKKMSRRNALFKQVAAAYSIDGTTKSVDFSKLLAIGNGLKVDTPIVVYEPNAENYDYETDWDLLNVPEGTVPSPILVAFNETDNQINIFNFEGELYPGPIIISLEELLSTDKKYYVYLTCDSKGQRVVNRGFGSFIIKTRPEKKGR